MGTIIRFECFQLVTFNRVILMEIRRLRDLREDHDKSQKAIAEYLNMHRGERETPAWVLAKLADYYHVSTDYLLGRTDRPEPYPVK